jgi:atypical dual specificity phosphatase
MTKIGNAYRWLHGNILQRPINFSWVVDRKLAGCRLPTTREECKWLVNIMGIRSIITVWEEPLSKTGL